MADECVPKGFEVVPAVVDFTSLLQQPALDSALSADISNLPRGLETTNMAELGPTAAIFRG